MEQWKKENERRCSTKTEMMTHCRDAVFRKNFFSRTEVIGIFILSTISPDSLNPSKK